MYNKALKRVLFRGYATANTTGLQLDQKWKKIWQENPSRKAKDLSKAPKYYVLAMFPYPSGALHMGHLRVYTISDTLARYRRMNGYNVVHAMGWDAFGLPAENAAIERQIDPAIWTKDNIKGMKDQIKMFADFDWEREVVSCSPEYYKWTQKLFIMLYESGLAYRKEAKVNWDPIDKTVLANEQVDDKGRSWRSGAVVEQKLLSQWFLGITKFAPDLLKDLELLKDWPEKVKAMQKNWIGQSHGANFSFRTAEGKVISTFTTRPDTLHGMQYVALALDHPLVKECASKDKAISDFLVDAQSFPEDTKLGIKLPIFVANPLEPSEFNVPVFAAPYVISDYGHGAVMGCPGHDSRDSEFWAQNMPGKPVSVVINPPKERDSSEPLYLGRDGTLNENCGEFAGMTSREGGRAIVDYLAKADRTNGENKPCAEHASQLKLRDWLISRQRFWGAPIPMIHCDNCGIVPVPDDQLPVKLPENVSSPLAQNEQYLKTKCPKCHSEEAKRDSDTMDTFMDSSWYFFRYTDPQNKEKIFDPKAASDLLPVDIYIGGIEHAILHLLYSRFISKYLASNGSWNGGHLNGEPFKRLVTLGMVHGKTYSDPDTGRFLKPHEVDLSSPESPKMLDGSDRIAAISSEKMSKSKYNGADPGACIEAHGADATRAHVLFQAPVTEVLNWDEDKIVGIERWLARVQSIVREVCSRYRESHGHTNPPPKVEYSRLNSQDEAFWTEVQEKTRSITKALHQDMGLNTLISDYMKLSRSIQSALDNGISFGPVYYATESFVKMISPVVPATGEECWEMLFQCRNGDVDSSKSWTSVFAEAWPHAESKPVSSKEKFNLIINGKRKAVIEVEKDMPEDEILALARDRANHVTNNKPIKKIVVPKGKRVISILTERN